MGKRKEITSKDNGKQKMWIIITVIIVFFAMAGYAGMSYYYSDRFFGEQRSMELTVLEKHRKRQNRRLQKSRGLSAGSKGKKSEITEYQWKIDRISLCFGWQYFPISG